MTQDGKQKERAVEREGRCLKHLPGHKVNVWTGKTFMGDGAWHDKFISLHP